VDLGERVGGARLPPVAADGEPGQEILVAEHGRGVGRARLSGCGVGARLQQGADDLRL
jgi:hypothetical protein